MIELRYLVFERRLSDRAQLVLVNSRGIRDELVTLARVRPERIRIIHNFLDLDRFCPPTDDERRAARARFAIPDGARVLVMPGRLSVQKHQIGLLLGAVAAREERTPARRGRAADAGTAEHRGGRMAGQAAGRAPGAARRRCG